MYHDTYHVTFIPVIKSFDSKALRQAFADGNYKGINAGWRKRIDLLLDALHAAERVEDLKLPTLGTHQLKGERKGQWAMTVNKNWRVTFKFENGGAYEVNLEDYH